MKKKYLIVIILLVAVFIIYFLAGGFKKKEKDESLELENILKEMGIQENNANGEMEQQNQESANQEEQVKKEILEQGSGAAAETGNTITVHYIGALMDGTKFDSSIDKEAPFSFTLGENRVIQGWELGLLGSQVGEKMRLTIPPQFGYGETGTPGGPIPPNATLIFEIEVLGIE